MLYDVVIVGGGPAGLSAALALGRARKRVLLCDSGPRRNALAEHIHNFVTRDGTTPDDFRRVARQQLATYSNVDAGEVRVASITGARGAFHVELAGDGAADARRVLLCTGMIDDMLPIDGFRELWGRAVFQCPYCHGWEMQDRRWGYLPRPGDVSHVLPFALQARGWTRDVTVFTNGAFDVPPETRAMFDSYGIRQETGALARLLRREHRLDGVALADGRTVPCDVLFAHPPQRHVDVVTGLGVGLDDGGYVQVDPVKRETTVPGIYAAGDLITRMQGAVYAAAAGTQAAAMINVDLAVEAPPASEI